MRQAFSFALGLIIALAGALLILALFALMALYAFYSLTLLSGLSLALTVIVGAAVIGGILAYKRLALPLSRRLMARR
jgi:hypothetical protein